MPFSIIMNGYPKDDAPVSHIQGPALQGMFLHLMEQVDPVVSARLHNDDRYRPFTLSPLGIGEPTPGPSREGNMGRNFRGFQLPREQMLKTGTPCYLRITLLEDDLFPTFSRYFLTRPEPTFTLGETQFTVTSVLATPESGNQWSTYIPYCDLIESTYRQAGCLRSQESNSPPGRGLTGMGFSESPLNPPVNGGKHADVNETSFPPLAGGTQGGQKNPYLSTGRGWGGYRELRQISLHFLTPTSFSKGDVDLPLPLPRLVFQSYLKRFNEFHDFAFLPDFLELVDLHTGIAELNRMRTDTIKTKKVTLIGFTGEVSFELSKHAPPELVCQMNLLADFAFFCGTGKKTTVGMGQTVRIKNEE